MPEIWKVETEHWLVQEEIFADLECGPIFLICFDKPNKKR